jgi:hypothetical protein
MLLLLMFVVAIILSFAVCVYVLLVIDSFKGRPARGFGCSHFRHVHRSR